MTDGSGLQSFHTKWAAHARKIAFMYGRQSRENVVLYKLPLVFLFHFPRQCSGSCQGQGKWENKAYCNLTHRLFSALKRVVREESVIWNNKNFLSMAWWWLGSSFAPVNNLRIKLGFTKTFKNIAKNTTEARLCSSITKNQFLKACIWQSTVSSYTK